MRVFSFRSLDRFVPVAVLSLIAGLFLSACGSGNHVDKQEAPSSISRVFESGHLRVEATITPAPAKTSEQITLRLRCWRPKGWRVVLEQQPGTIGDLQLRETGVVREQLDQEGGTHEVSWVYEPFLPGEFEVPPIEIVTRALDGSKAEGARLITEPIPFEVQSVLPSDSETELGDLEKAASSPPPKSAWPWIGALAGLLTMGFALAVQLRRKRKESASEDQSEADIRAALLEAGNKDATSLSHELALHAETLSAWNHRSPAGAVLHARLEEALEAACFGKTSPEPSDLPKLLRSYLDAVPE